jgi:hypothetical protein
MKFDWRQLFSFYQRFSTRERLLLGVAGGAVVVIALYTLVWEPLVVGRETMQKRIAIKQREVVEVQRLRETYLELLRQFEANQAVLDRAEPNFSLFPYIESTVSKLFGRDHISSMNPQSKKLADAYMEDSVEFKLTSISLEQLVDMLYGIEKGPHPLRLTRLQVKKKYRDPHSFDVTATVSMLKPATSS